MHQDSFEDIMKGYTIRLHTVRRSCVPVTDSVINRLVSAPSTMNPSGLCSDYAPYALPPAAARDDHVGDVSARRLGHRRRIPPRRGPTQRRDSSEADDDARVGDGRVSCAPRGVAQYCPTAGTRRPRNAPRTTGGTCSTSTSTSCHSSTCGGQFTMISSSPSPPFGLSPHDDT